MFFTVHTLLINEPEFCDENKIQVWNILNKLIDEGLIEEDAFVISNGNYKPMTELFHASDYVSQNNILYLEKRGAQQSMWVKVEIINDIPALDINSMVESGVKTADEKEIEKLSKLQKVAEKFKQVYAMKKANLKV